MKRIEILGNNLVILNSSAEKTVGCKKKIK